MRSIGLRAINGPLYVKEVVIYSRLQFDGEALRKDKHAHTFLYTCGVRHHLRAPHLTNGRLGGERLNNGAFSERVYNTGRCPGVGLS